VTPEQHTNAAAYHAQQANSLLRSVDSRRDEGPGFGAVKAASAQAHAALALYHQREAA